MPTNRAEVLDVPLLLDGLPGSQSSRVHAGLRAAILGGRLAAGLRLPSSRSFADQLGVRRNAVVAAYEHLLSDGLAEARVGAGTYVAARVPRGPAGPAPVLPPITAPPQRPFALGRTYADPAMLRAFSRAIRQRLSRADPAHFGYADPRGGAELRAAIAGHLAATRGIVCDPARIIVTSGTRHALRLCADVLLRPGDRAWMEEPGYPTARRSIEAAGAVPVAVPADAEGIDAAEGRRRAPDARIAYVTPSHQFPTGVTMSMRRRIALLEWARDARAWVLEDDYDSEFRYAGPPLTALAGIDEHARVIYIGTFSKTLFAGLRIGFMVVPPSLLAELVAARAVADRFPPSLLDAALADLIASGGFAAHIRRMRSRYRAARDLVAGTVTRASDGLLQVAVPDQGLHLLATLPPDLPPDTARAIRVEAGIEAWLLSETRMVSAGPDGFVLGFSGHDRRALKCAAERLGGAVRRRCATAPLVSWSAEADHPRLPREPKGRGCSRQA